MWVCDFFALTSMEESLNIWQRQLLRLSRRTLRMGISYLYTHNVVYKNEKDMYVLLHQHNGVNIQNMLAHSYSTVNADWSKRMHGSVHTYSLANRLDSLVNVTYIILFKSYKWSVLIYFTSRSINLTEFWFYIDLVIICNKWWRLLTVCYFCSNFEFSFDSNLLLLFYFSTVVLEVKLWTKNGRIDFSGTGMEIPSIYIQNKNVWT